MRQAERAATSRGEGTGVRSLSRSSQAPKLPSSGNWRGRAWTAARQGRVSEGLAYIGMAAERLEESASATRLKENVSHDYTGMMKSATSSPRPKLKGSRSTQSVGAASSMTMSTGECDRGRPSRGGGTPSRLFPRRLLPASHLERLLTRVVFLFTPLPTSLSRAQSPACCSG